MSRVGGEAHPAGDGLPVLHVRAKPEQPEVADLSLAARVEPPDTDVNRLDEVSRFQADRGVAVVGPSGPPRSLG